MIFLTLLSERQEERNDERKLFAVKHLAPNVPAADEQETGEARVAGGKILAGGVDRNRPTIKIHDSPEGKPLRRGVRLLRF